MRNSKKIFTQKLEKINSDIFNPKYKDIITEEIRNKHGVYVLYDKKEEPYYIGQVPRKLLND